MINNSLTKLGPIISKGNKLDPKLHRTCDCKFTQY